MQYLVNIIDKLPGIFVTGTSTNVGKTFFSAFCLRALLTHNLDAYYWKPLQTGNDSDSATVQKLADVPSHRILKPQYELAPPLSPYCAAQITGQTIQIASVIDSFQVWQQKSPTRKFIVEGAGGLLVPITTNYTMRELAMALQLPLVIVALTTLGTINHTLLTIEAAKQAGLTIAALILQGENNDRLYATLQDFVGNIPIFYVPQLMQ